MAIGLGASVMWWAVGSSAQVLTVRHDSMRFAIQCLLAEFGSTWLATVFWNPASQWLRASLYRQQIVSKTLFVML